MSKFAVILFMVIGISLGRLCRRIKVPWIQSMITILIWALLFLLGIEAGSNESVVKSLPKIGLDAVIITAAAVFGSALGAKLLWNYLKKNDKL